jgi:hypothetical protein
VEALAFLSLLKWLQNQDYPILETNHHSWLINKELIILNLLRMLRCPVPFSTIFNFHNTPAWANDMVQIVGCLDGMDVAVDVLGEVPKIPGLGVVHYAAGVEDVIRWIEAPDTAPAVLVSTNLFGLDIMLRCRSASSNSTVASTKCFLMGKLKSFTDIGNEESVNAGTVSCALTSLARDHWFIQTVCQLASSLFSPHYESRDSHPINVGNSSMP